ncbi:MAG: DUF1257 domain-containing protein [Roseofilum sp. SID3]|uniref:DUF1257 domain-containing protein n=1 Tax=Roseofilum sp. SID3 TaxID=2821499 RepID=UPI001B09E38C|nr:DUF1257 domain-containing protein [Roseofilum sp. SID3]MBP0015309.1 DUF1257 domain-containing protein [Roseofilum sp. SID3]
MSHLTTVKTQMKDFGILESCVVKLVSEMPDAELRYGGEIRDWGTRKRKCDLAIAFPGEYNTRNASRNFGFTRNKQGVYEMVHDGMYRDGSEFLKKLIPMYSKEMTLFSLSSQGFDINSIQEEEDGTIKIIAGKWQ